MSVVYGNTAVSKPGTVVSRTGGTSSTCSIATRRSSGAHRACAPRAASLDGPEHHLGLGRRRDDVRRDAAGDQADGVVRPAEHRIGRQLDRRAARSARRSACRSPTRRARETTNARRGRVARSLSAQDAARRQAEAVVGRLAVDQKPAPVGAPAFGDSRAVAAALLADDEQQADARLAVAPQPLGGRDLRGEDALRVARRRGRRGGRPRRGSERTAARSRSAWRSTTARRCRARRDHVEPRRRRPAAR